MDIDGITKYINRMVLALRCSRCEVKSLLRSSLTWSCPKHAPRNTSIFLQEIDRIAGLHSTYSTNLSSGIETINHCYCKDYDHLELTASYSPIHNGVPKRYHDVRLFPCSKLTELTAQLIHDGGERQMAIDLLRFIVIATMHTPHSYKSI